MHISYNRVTQPPDSFDFHLDSVAWFQENLRVAPDANTVRSARADEISWLEGNSLREIGD